MGMELPPAAILYITEPPIFEVSGGVFSCKARSGQSVIVFAMSPKCFARGLDRAKSAERRFASGEQDIVADD